MAVIKLSTTEMEILRHRLEFPENIAECVCNDDTTLDAVESCASSLLDGMSRAGSLPSAMTALEKRVLIDCLAGSTYATVWLDGSVEATRAVAAGRALCRKLAKPLGRLVTFPKH
jgi:hypothetical protein